VLNQNQFGGVFGGPVKKDKLFFFASYQETRQKNGFPSAGYSVPILPYIPASFASGATGTGAATTDRSDPGFAYALGQLFHPKGLGTLAGASVAAPFNGGTTVAPNGANISPVALALFNLKLPNGQYMIPSAPASYDGSTSLFSDVISEAAQYTEHQAIGNFDYIINEKNTFSGRWTYSDAITNAPIGCNITSTSTTSCLEGSGATVLIPTQYVTGKLTTTLTSNLVNEARFSLQRSVGKPENQISYTDSQVGITPVQPTINYLNGITITGLFQFGAQLKNDTDKFNLAYEAADQISWTHGKHTIRAGFEYERDRQDWHFGGLAIGSTTFPTFTDFLIGLPGCANAAAANCAPSMNTGGPQTPGQTNGTGFSNLSATGNSVGIGPIGGEDYQFRAPVADAFLQDDFKVRSNVTLNLGVRWEWFPLNYAANGENTNLWPFLVSAVPNAQLGTTPQTGTLAGFVVPSNFNFGAFPAPPVGGIFVNNKKIPTQNNAPIANFAPRIGVAWKPLASDRLVFRSGFGSFYDRAGNTIYNKPATQGYPYDVAIGQSTNTTSDWFASAAAPYCVGPNAPTPNLTGACNIPTLGWAPRWFNPAANSGAGSGSNLVVLSTSPIYYVPVTYEWNANIQYEFANQWVLELGYVGSRGVHQVPDATLANGIIERYLNQPLLASPSNPLDCGNGGLVGPCVTTNTKGNTAQRVPYLGFATGTGIQSDQTTWDAKFNSLQATITKRFSHGLQMQAAYTWARGFDTSSYVAYNNAALPEPYGPMPYLRPQRLSVSYSYDLPFGKREGLVGKVANGWTVSGVTVAQDGFAQTITDANGGNIYGTNTSTANYAAGEGPANVATSGGTEARLGGPVNGGPGWFNIGAFAKFVSSGANGYGNSGYGIVLGPGQFNWDMSLVKTTKVGGLNENATLVFRSEFFNTFNHPQFGPNPSSNAVSSSSFGLINTTAVNPRLVQFALKYVF
jgi:hypothetical protein